MRIPKIFWVFVLLFFVGVLAYSGYMIYQRVSLCDQINRINSAIPPSDIENHIRGEMAYRRICQDNSNIVGLIIGGIGCAWAAWKLYLGYMIFDYKQEK